MPDLPYEVVITLPIERPQGRLFDVYVIYRERFDTAFDAGNAAHDQIRMLMDMEIYDGTISAMVDVLDFNGLPMAITLPGDEATVFMRKIGS